MRLHPDLRVVQRRGALRWTELAAERFHWARLFAARRFEPRQLGARLLFGLAAPLLPALFFARIALGQVRRGKALSFAWAAPWVVFLLVPKSLGEAVGYLTARR